MNDDSPTPDPGPRPSPWRRLLRLALGIRPGHGEGDRVILVSADAEGRSLINWVLPALGGLFSLGLLAFLWSFFRPANGFPAMMYRVFVLDYTIFLWGLLSGLNMARRWRANADQVEELSLTPLLPTVIPSMMVAGPCAVWLRVILVMALVELLLPIPMLVELSGAVGEVPPAAMGALVTFTLVAAVALPVAFAWFHFESVRLAHWIMVVHAMPKVSLVSAGVSGLLVMTLIVLCLSALGSVVTTILVFVLMAVGGVFLAAMGVSNLGVVSYAGVGLAAIPALLVVAWLKRAGALNFERRFTQAWLLYQWWGAGERQQPRAYPHEFHRQLPLWHAWVKAQEEEVAGGGETGPARRRFAAQVARQAVLTARGPAFGPPTLGSSSGSPSRSPGPHSGS